MYVLGSVLLDPDKQLLTIEDRTIALQRKPFLVLLFLIENRHRMVNREELLKEFWDGQEVYDQSLSKAVGTIRKALGEPAASDYIETRWGLGYRYIGPFLESSGHPQQAAAPAPMPESSVSAERAVAEIPVAATPWKRWRIAGLAAAFVFMLAGVAAMLAQRHVPVSKPAQAAAASLPDTQASIPDTRHPEAYAQYTKAEFFAKMRTPASIAKAIDQLNEVILIDPKYARAYAALAECYGLQGFYHFVPPAEAYPRAKDAAYKALALDNSLVQAHVALLGALTDYDWDWEGAEREYKAAIALDPNYAAAYQYFGYALLGAGRGREALVVMKHAAELDPVSPSVLTSLAWGYFLQRDDKHAVEQCQRVLELYPNFVVAHQVLGMIYGQMGLRQQALAELHRASALETDSTITPMLLDYELARSGKRAEVVRNLTSLEASQQNASVPDYYLALAWTATGNEDKAQAALERAYDARSHWMIYLQYDPRFDELRRKAPFQKLVREVASPRRQPRNKPTEQNLAQVG